MSLKRTSDSQTSDVVFVSLPFGVLHSPSLALGILQARLNAAGISAKCRHFTLDYAAIVGRELYNKIASGFPRTTDLLGEWIFSHAVWPKSTATQEKYLERIFSADGSDFEEPDNRTTYSEWTEKRMRLVETIQGLAASAGEFIDYAVREILSFSPKLVGFTTVFQQNLATIAVAARLRELNPSLTIVLGGANCEGLMGQELARAFPFVDFMISGEADLVIVPLVRSVLAGEDPHTSLEVRRYAECATGSGPFLQTKLVTDLNDYVSPSFDDYFQDIRRFSNEANGMKIHLPLETSRGCWWGMTHHCTFCGLNGSTMLFRSRRPDDALREIVENASKYPGAKISFVDNIMDYKYYDLMLPKLAELSADLDLFYEIKSNVTKPQVKALKDAGVKHIQPGIESLSDQVLKIMKKGVKAIQNVQLLKWCTEYAIKADWNFLWGFPGEDSTEYQRMAHLVPSLCHLEPPARGSEIRLDRFSPNFTRSSELGFFNVRPYEAYYDVYEGVAPEAVFNLSYFFKADGVPNEEIRKYTRELSDAIAEWRASHAASSLIYIELDDRVVVFDSRAMVHSACVEILDALQSRIFLFCDKARTASAIMREVPDASWDRIEKILNRFCEQRTMWFDGEHYLSLAVSFTTFLQSRGTVNVEEAIDNMLSERDLSY